MSDLVAASPSGGTYAGLTNPENELGYGGNLRLASALSYVKRGWPVFPLHTPRPGRGCSCQNEKCGSAGKHPRTKHGLHGASKDPETIIKWWQQFPDANIGIRTGSASGIWVLDLDGAEGEASFAALQAVHGTISPTLQSKTGTGGHLVFIHPPGRKIRSSTRKIARGIDVRAEGAYIVAPPSLHHTGAQYCWAGEELNPVAAAAWLLQLAEGSPRITGSAAQLVDDIPEGRRNEMLTSLGGTMRRRGMTAQAIEAALQAENVARCHPPLPTDEVRRIASSVARYDPGPRTDGPLSRPVNDVAELRAANWPKPEQLGSDLPLVEEFSPDLLPESFRDFVNDVSERMQTPPDYAAAASVANLAGCVNRRAVMQPKVSDTGWVVVPNLWGANIGPPGLLKSPLLNTITSPVRAVDECWRQEHASALDEFEFEKERADLAHAAWRDSYKLAIKRNGTIPVRPDPSLKPPTRRRLLVVDATMEKLHEILAENPAGVLVVRDELTGWLAELERPGREGERAFYLSAWNGDTSHTIDRIGRGSIHVPACCVSLFGNIQPARLRTYLTDALHDGPANDGLFQRLQLLVWPDVPQQWSYVDRAPNLEAQHRVRRVLEVLSQER
jgi:hypothetical protein